jgi:hypothetical protein
MNMVRRIFLLTIFLSCISIEETIECYLDSILRHGNQHELIDQRTSQWIDDIRSVNMIIIYFRSNRILFVFVEYSFLFMFER